MGFVPTGDVGMKAPTEALKRREVRVDFSGVSGDVLAVDLARTQINVGDKSPVLDKPRSAARPT